MEDPGTQDNGDLIDDNAETTEVKILDLERELWTEDAVSADDSDGPEQAGR